MKVDVKKQNGIMNVAVTGEINTVTTPQLMKEVDNLGGITKLVFDLDNVRYVSSAGLRLFLNCQRTMTEAGGEMMIVNCDEFVIETFVSVGYHRIINVKAKEML